MAKKEYMSEKEIYEAFKVIKKIDAPINIKVRVLSELLGGYEHIWQVTAITKNALIRFHKFKYKKESGMKINRAHINDRADTYEFLLNSNLNFDQWWRHFIPRNKTILAISEENKNIKLVPSNEKFVIPKNLNLFKSSGFAWRHGKLETEFLKQLYKEKIGG
jgi:hypothetical protein